MYGTRSSFRITPSPCPSPGVPGERTGEATAHRFATLALVTGETLAFIAGAVVILTGTWVFAGRWLSLGPGRWLTSGAPVTPVRPVAVDDHRLILDSRKWDFDHRESRAWRIKIV